MKRIFLFFSLGFLLITLGSQLFAKTQYVQNICHEPGYSCLKIKRGDTWQKLWPGTMDQLLVRKVNRMNTRLYPGLTIAVPGSLSQHTLITLSPLPKRLEPMGEKVILIVMALQAFGAYDEYGYLQYWGPVSGGKGYCPDVGRVCRSPLGKFRVYSKQGPGCISNKFPVPNGGSKMPYCMFFYGGYAMHGGELPGYHASHGCVRMFADDAKWLNHNFVKTGKNGTRVIVLGASKDLETFISDMMLIAGNRWMIHTEL